MNLIYTRPQRARWHAEHIQLRPPDEGFIRSTITTMFHTQRARNIHEIEHSGKRFMQFERRVSLTFKRIIRRPPRPPPITDL